MSDDLFAGDGGAIALTDDHSNTLFDLFHGGPVSEIGAVTDYGSRTSATHPIGLFGGDASGKADEFLAGGGDGFFASMHGPDVSALTRANESFASNMLASMKASTDAAFNPPGGQPGGGQPGGQPGSGPSIATPVRPMNLGVANDPAMADALHMALEKGVDSAVFKWAAQADAAGSTPSVNPDEEIWSSPIGGVLSHEEVQAQQAQGLLDGGGQGWFDRFMVGDIYEETWSSPIGGIYSHQAILNKQAEVLARGYQNPFTWFMEGDVFSGYRDDVTGKIGYSAPDAREVSAKMAMYNADRARYGAIGNMWAGRQPGTGFDVDDGFYQEDELGRPHTW